MPHREAEGGGGVLAEGPAEDLRLWVCRRIDNGKNPKPSTSEEPSKQKQSTPCPFTCGVRARPSAPYSVSRMNVAAFTAASRYADGSAWSTGKRIPPGLGCPARTRDALANALIARPGLERTRWFVETVAVSREVTVHEAARQTSSLLSLSTGRNPPHRSTRRGSCRPGAAAAASRGPRAAPPGTPPAAPRRPPLTGRAAAPSAVAGAPPGGCSSRQTPLRRRDMHFTESGSGGPGNRGAVGLAEC